MEYVNITYRVLELIFECSLRGNHIIAIEPHPFMARTLAAYFHDEEEPILLTDEIIEKEKLIWTLIAE